MSRPVSDVPSRCRPGLDRGEDKRMVGLGPVIVNFATLTSDGCHERGKFVGMWRLKKTHGLDRTY